MVSLVAATTVYADTPIKDRQAWISGAFSQLQKGDISEIQKLLDETLGQEMHNDVMRTVMSLDDIVGDAKLLSYDELSVEKLGQSFEVYEYAAYYGGRDYLFFRFTFTRLGKTWHLWSLDYTEDLPE